MHNSDTKRIHEMLCCVSSNDVKFQNFAEHNQLQPMNPNRGIPISICPTINKKQNKMHTSHNKCCNNATNWPQPISWITKLKHKPNMLKTLYLMKSIHGPMRKFALILLAPHSATSMMCWIISEARVALVVVFPGINSTRTWVILVQNRCGNHIHCWNLNNAHATSINCKKSNWNEIGSVPSLTVMTPVFNWDTVKEWLLVKVENTSLPRTVTLSTTSSYKFLHPKVTWETTIGLPPKEN